jgi:hypothetical protein
MNSKIKKGSFWSIKLNKDSSRKSLQVEAVKKERIEFVVLRFPNIVWALPKEKFLEHFEPSVEKN